VGRSAIGVCRVRFPPCRSSPLPLTVTLGVGALGGGTAGPRLLAVNTALALCGVAFGNGLPVYVVRVLPVPAWIVVPLLGAAIALAPPRAPGRRLAPHLIAGDGVALWTAWAALMASLVALPRPSIVPALVPASLLYDPAEPLHATTTMHAPASCERNSGVDQFEEAQEFLVAVAVALRDHRTGTHIEGGEKAGRAVPDVVVVKRAGVGGMTGRIDACGCSSGSTAISYHTRRRAAGRPPDR
jgi:hypothetical protein